MNCNRLSLNLLHYYQDYRQLTRICIKDEIETIGDLEKHIAVLFDIEGKFYLECNNFYLPSSESVLLLDDNDLVSVIPNCDNEEAKESTETQVILKQKTKKLKNKDKIEKNEVAESSWDKKNKPIENNNLETNDEEKIVSGTEEKVPRPKKKKFKINNVVFKEVNENDVEVKEKTKKSKKKDFINVQTEIEVHATYTENEEKENSRVHDTSVENYENEDKIRKRRRCITPKKSSEKEYYENGEISNTSENNETQTKTLNGDEKMEINLPPPSNLINNKEKQQEYSDKLVTSYEATDFENPDTSKYNYRKSVFKEHKENSGLGNVLKFISAENSVNESENDSCTQSENNFITKRKRCRVRHRKKKDKLEEEVIPEIPIFKPPNTKAAPKSHIKFSEFAESNINIFQSTPIKGDKERNIVDKTSSAAVKTKLAFRNADLSKCADLVGVPIVNNLIIFKRLKLAENYEPVISNYILAEVNDVIENGKQLKVTIIDGLTEFKDPNGRFSCVLEEDGDVIDETIIIFRTEIIEPKLFQV